MINGSRHDQWPLPKGSQITRLEKTVILSFDPQLRDGSNIHGSFFSLRSSEGHEVSSY